jgi:hypothetical protein
MEVTKMSNRTNKGNIPAALMPRVDACALIFTADKPEKIKAIAEKCNTSLEVAGRIYTIGALKATKRRGTARNYYEAVEQLENEQTGDRGNVLTRTLSADKTARTITHINRVNNAGDTAVYREGFIVDPTGYTVQTRFFKGNVKGKAYPEKADRPHTVNMGKVFGTLYTEWEVREAETAPDHVYNMTAEVIAHNVSLYFADYTRHQSKTVKNRIAELQRYTGELEALLSVKGRKDPETSGLAKFVDHLHYHFEHKDTLTVSMFADLLKRYTPESIA